MATATSSLAVLSPKPIDTWDKGDSKDVIRWTYPSAVMGHEVWMDVSLSNPVDIDPRDAVAEYTSRFTVPTSSNIGQLNWDVFQHQPETPFGNFLGKADLVITLEDDLDYQMWTATTSLTVASSVTSTTITPVTVTSPRTAETYKIGQTMNIALAGLHSRHRYLRTMDGWSPGWIWQPYPILGRGYFHTELPCADLPPALRTQTVR